jgi:hypothetical protein
VLDWLGTPDAARQAARLAARWGLTGYDALVDNVLAEARVALWQRMRSDRPLRVDNAAGYGTAVIRSVLRHASRGRTDDVPLEDTHPSAALGAELDGDAAADGVRVHLEQLDDGRPWVTAAALGALVLLVDPDAVPPGSPWPRAGAREDQARCWPALWFAGERDLFDGVDDARADARIRRTRARHIAVVTERLQQALARCALELRAGAGHHG